MQGFYLLLEEIEAIAVQASQFENAPAPAGKRLARDYGQLLVLKKRDILNEIKKSQIPR